MKAYWTRTGFYMVYVRTIRLWFIEVEVWKVGRRAA